MACESLPSASRAPASDSVRAGPIPSARSRSVVGHRQTDAPAPPSSAMSSAVTWVAWIAVKRSVRAPASHSTAVGVAPWCSRANSFSAGCSETCACSGAPRCAAHAATTRAASESTARTLWIAAPAPSSCATRSAHASAEASRNRALPPSR